MYIFTISKVTCCCYCCCCIRRRERERKRKKIFLTKRWFLVKRFSSQNTHKYLGVDWTRNSLTKATLTKYTQWQKWKVHKWPVIWKSRHTHTEHSRTEQNSREREREQWQNRQNIERENSVYPMSPSWGYCITLDTQLHQGQLTFRCNRIIQIQFKVLKSWQF